MIFENKIAELLTSNGLKQAALCRLTGIPTFLMSNYVKWKVSPTLNNAIKIADALNITLDALAGRNDGVVLDAEETELIAMYRELDETQKKKFSVTSMLLITKKVASKNSLDKFGNLDEWNIM